MRLSELKLEPFKNYLRGRFGASIDEPDTQWVVLRYTIPYEHANEPDMGTHFIYRNAKGRLRFVDQAERHYKEFLDAQG